MVRRYERDRPGELVHIDVKKLARIPNGGGWRIHGRSEEVRGNGYDYFHVAVDDATRVAYVEVYPHERASAGAEHLAGTIALFDRLGVRIERVMTDNALAYVSGRAFPGPARPRPDHPQAHPLPPTTDQRQSRTLQPHPARRVRLRPTLALQPRTP